MKRLNTLLVVLVTLSMLVVPLASAATLSPETAGQETLSTQPQTDDAASLAQPAPQVMFAQPTGEGPVLSADGMGQQPAPAMSIVQPVDEGKLAAAQEPVAPAFELVSVIRSCDDLTRFDLTWTGTGTISSIEYVLYNSSDNGSTPGTINGADISGTSASITGRPGDTAVSVDVVLTDGGLYRYVADGSECGVSSLSVTEQPVPNNAPTVMPTEESVAKPVTAESTPKVAADETTNVSNVLIHLQIEGSDELAGESSFSLCISEPYRTWPTIACKDGLDPSLSQHDLQFENIPVGTYNLHVPARGFHFYTGWVLTVDPNQTTEMTIVWKKNPTSLLTFEVDYLVSMPLIPIYINFYALDTPTGNAWYTSIKITDGTPVTVEVPSGASRFYISPLSGYEVRGDHATHSQDGQTRLTFNSGGEYYFSWYVVPDEDFSSGHVNVLFEPNGGDSLEGAQVCLESTNQWNYIDHRCVTLDESNNADFGRMSNGSYHVTFHTYKNYPSWDSRFDGANLVVDGERGPTNETIHLQRVDAGSVVVQAGEWRAGATVVLTYDYSNQVPYQKVAALDENGNFTFDFVWVGTYELSIYSTDGLYRHQTLVLTIAADGEVIVVTPQYSGYAWRAYSGYYTAPGQTVVIEGSSFGPGEEVSFRWAAADGIEIGSPVVSDEAGKFRATVVIPQEIPLGTFMVHSVGSHGTRATTAIDVNRMPPAITVSPDTGSPASTVTVSGTRFTEAETVFILWGSADGPRLGDAIVDWDGTFSLNVTVPVDSNDGPVSIYAVSTYESATGSFTVTAGIPVDIDLSPTSGRAGTVTTITGSGFKPGETVSLRWGSASGPVLGSVVVKVDGTFSGKVTVPSYAGVGAYEIHAVSASGSATASYQVTALAVVKVTVSPTSGRAGTVTTVSGSGYQPGETVTVRWGGPTGTVLGSVKASASGTIAAKVTVPATAATGSFAIHVTGTSGQTGNASYQVTALAIVKVIVGPISGRAGTVTSVTGSGYRPGETVTIRWSTTTGTLLGSVKATTSGTISAKITVPATAAVGTFRVYATGTSGQAGSATYQVTALSIVKVALSPAYGRAGTVTTVTGSGFRPGETVTIRWGGATGTILGSVRATTSGTISAKVTVPATAALGTFTIRATGASGQLGTAPYKVTALAIVKITLSPASGRAGTVTTVSGSGFRPGETVTIRWASASGTVLGSVKATANGTFSAKVTVPRSSTVRAYTIYVAGGTSLQRGTAAYTVTLLAASSPVRPDTWAGRMRQPGGAARM